MTRIPVDKLLEKNVEDVAELLDWSIDYAIDYKGWKRIESE